MLAVVSIFPIVLNAYTFKSYPMLNGFITVSRDVEQGFEKSPIFLVGFIKIQVHYLTDDFFFAKCP